MGVSKSGWSGVNARIVKRQSTMEELVAQGFEVVDWDGWCVTLILYSLLLIAPVKHHSAPCRCQWRCLRGSRWPPK